MTPPRDAIEIQPRIKPRGLGNGGGGTRGQSRIVALGDVAWIDLGHDCWAMIDRGDIELMAELCWHRHMASHTCYAARTIKIDGKPKLVLLHRQIMGGDAPYDHIDCDGLNNRRANLRGCTALQNAQNRRKNLNNSVGLKNVTFRKEIGKYRARLHINGKRVSLGSFNTPEEAHEAFSEAARRHHGEFARIN